jgi:hypothetical protein
LRELRAIRFKFELLRFFKKNFTERREKIIVISENERGVG